MEQLVSIWKKIKLDLSYITHSLSNLYVGYRLKCKKYFKVSWKI